MLKKYNQLKNTLSKVPKYMWVLCAITAIGIFLRTYHFREWLYFYPDQARDATIVGDYLSGKISLPLMGFRAQSTTFMLGAMYYYFQIISGKIFGVAPQTMAYPDLLFNVLSIPLFFYFLKRYFKTNISLALTAIYSFSFFSIEFSRFAWNPNPMPFFVILYLLALSKLLSEKDKVRWGWIIAMGIAVGVGIQLHTILIFLMVSMSAAAMLVSLWGNWRLWSRWAAIAGIVLLLNSNQIWSETHGHQSNFPNTKKLLSIAISTSGDAGSQGKLSELYADAACQAQANFHIISSLGDKVSCDYLDNAAYFGKQKFLGLAGSVSENILIAMGAFVSILGYIFLVYFWRTEKNKARKIFLGLIIFYSALSFAILFPILVTDAKSRYFLQVFFVPYIFLGLLMEFVKDKMSKIFLPVLLATLLLLLGANASTIFAEGKLYASHQHSNSQYVVLGELEQMRDYIIREINSPPAIYMVADGKYMQNYFYPMQYVMKEKSVILNRNLKDSRAIPAEAAVFVVADRINSGSGMAGRMVKSSRYFGEVGIYILDSTLN